MPSGCGRLHGRCIRRLACSSCEQAGGRFRVSQPLGAPAYPAGASRRSMGTLLAPKTVCGRLSNPSLSLTRPIHGPVLTCCELVCVPGRPMGAAAGASKGATARTGARTGRRVLQVAAAAHAAAAQRVRARLERALVCRCWVRCGIGCALPWVATSASAVCSAGSSPARWLVEEVPGPMRVPLVHVGSASRRSVRYFQNGN